MAVAALPPIEREDVDTWLRALPSEFEYRRELPERDERPVPPREIARDPTQYGVKVKLSEEGLVIARRMFASVEVVARVCVPPVWLVPYV